jgi:hypothetical protein
MNIRKKEKRLIIALMIIVLICLLFFSSVAFGQVSDPSPLGDVHGTVFYSDGRRLPLNDSTNATDLMVVNKDTNSNIVFTTNESGGYDSGDILQAGNYTIYACYQNTVVASHDFAINRNLALGDSNDIPLDLTTSRTSTN